MKNVTKEMSSALASNSSRAKSLATKYGLELISKEDLNAFDSKVKSYGLEDDQVKKIFASSGVVTFDGPSYNWVIKINNKNKKSDLSKIIQEEKNQLGSQITRKFRSELIAKLTQSSSISCLADFDDVKACTK